jgi:hypothetical protein
VPLFTPEIRGGELQEGEGADREDDHPDGIHVPHPAWRRRRRKSGERHILDRPDDVGDRTARLAVER